MANISEILKREFIKVRNSDSLLETGTRAEAEFLGISPSHLSRIRNGKSPLTEEIINKIADSFAEYTNIDDLKEELRTATIKDTYTTGNLSEKYSIERAEELFEKLSNPESLLCVDYRDFPQATIGASYPILAKKAAEAVRKGLRFALFQPFGSAESLRNMISALNQQLAHPKAMVAMKAYLYLYELALRVRQVYTTMKEESKGGTGQIVLYEAQIEKPMITAIGLQSRLFLADYFEGNLHQRQIFEWVTAPNNEHFFIERSLLSLNIEAVRLQFHPIHKYWEEKNALPENIKEDKKKNIKGKAELSKAYENYAIETLLGKGVIKWENWSESNEEK